MRVPLLLIVMTIAGLPALAQQSESFTIEQSSFSSGGLPQNGNGVGSASFSLTMTSLAGGLAAPQAASESFGMSGGFGTTYRPPGEVLDLRFTAGDTLEWSPEPSAGSYNLYRASVGTLADLTYGLCEQQELPAAGTTDGDTPGIDDGFFYLVTVNNRLGEEGTKGPNSEAETREGNTCP